MVCVVYAGRAIQGMWKPSPHSEEDATSDIDVLAVTLSGTRRVDMIDRTAS